MPVFQLGKEPIFPHTELAEESGLLAIGGDLTTERLVQAYAHGIFPWYSEGEPVMWWSPDPRMVLYLNQFKVSKSLKQLLRNNTFRVEFDTNFRLVIESCAQVPRAGQKGTWITQDMKNAYIDLHASGYAHSVEVYEQHQLVGGLYGVNLGKTFFGESMFHKKRCFKGGTFSPGGKIEKMEISIH